MTPDEAAFLRSFEDCTLPAEQWTHAAHIRMAWLCLQSDEFAAALDRIRSGILRYNGEVLNKLAEYHETVTVAFATLVAARLCANEPWEEFVRRNDDLFARTPPVLAHYYSMERLMSAVARQDFLEPDLCALPALAGQGPAVRRKQQEEQNG